MSTISTIRGDGWQKLLESDPEALLTLYREHYLGLVNYGYRLTGDRAVSNDCITQVLIDLWEKRKTLPEVSNVRSYLLTCLHRKILLELKLSRSRSFQEAESGEEVLGWESSYEEVLLQAEGKEEWRKRLERAFARLTKRQTELLRMRFYEDEDYDAIAVKCGITKRTAYNIIHEALRILRATLEEEGRGNPSVSQLPGHLLLVFLFEYFVG